MTYPFLSSMLIVLLLALASALIGRCFAVAVQSRILLRRDPETFLACMFVGTGLLTLSSGWGTYHAMPAPQALHLTEILFGGMTLVALWRGGSTQMFVWPRRRGVLNLIGGCLLIRAGLCLYPLLLGCTLTPYNDTFCYISAAEYLQTHDFITRAPLDPDRPTWAMVTGLQLLNHRMGPIYLLAMLQAVMPSFSAFELYPAMVAWGAALNVAGAFLLARWTLGAPRFPALVGAFLAAIAADSLTFSAGCGFLCSVYGTATLVFGLAVLSRLTPRINWQNGNAWLFGLCVAMQFSVYGELSPLLGVASVVWLIQNWLRARVRGDRRPFFILVSATVLAMVALANIEIVRVYQSLHSMTDLEGVGWHVPWRTTKFFKFASGAHMIDWLYSISSSGIKTILLCGLTAIAFGLGLKSLWRSRRRSVPLMFALLVFVGLALWSRYRTRDPWSGEIGHTFNLFKLCQWFFPFALAIKMAGMGTLLGLIQRLRPSWACAVPFSAGVICVGATALHLPIQHQGARKLQTVVWLDKGTPHPIQEFAALRQRIDQIAPTNIFYVQDEASAFNNSFICYALNRYPFLNSWNYAGQVGAPWLCQNQYDRCNEGTLFLQFGTPPFEEPAERLPFNYSVMDRSRPVIFAVSAMRTTPNNVGRRDYWAGEIALHLEIVSPHTCRAELFLEVVSEVPSGQPPFSINDVKEWTTIGERTERGTFLIAARVSLSRGLSRIVLRSRIDGNVAWGIRDAKLNELSNSDP